ncbi:transglutaminase-like domain-containing protein [Crateriforma spongiae]|uniref:transglutaminase-like domain-containing protein n=1 Tax=Crateriforma spongiae TaxID=2724528 RepID=UPI00144694A9|nr:transglutaminase domain-containing protein [Crateriforma spongiae]
MPLDRRQFCSQSLAGLTAVSAATTLGYHRDAVAQSRRSRRGDQESEGTPRVSFDLPQTHRWRMGLSLKTGSTCQNVIATFPIPVNWPEQEVRLVAKNIDNPMTRWITRPAPGGTTQVVASVAKVAASSETEIMFEFDVKKHRIVAPEVTDDLVIPTRPSRDIKLYLGTSPEIDHTHRTIRAAYAELSAEPYDNAWQLVERMYDYVRDNVRYVNGPIQRASLALENGYGDCEEMTSLVVALCRNAKIPARMVWVPEHCYPEFYLEDADGDGHWFPCQAAGTRQFGGIEEYRPVLQKGDRFRVPEKRGKPQRYLTEFFTCEVKGRSDPNPTFVLEQVDV